MNAKTRALVEKSLKKNIELSSINLELCNALMEED